MLYSPTALGLVPMNPDDLYNQAFQLRCNGQYAEAQALLQRLLQIDPNHVNGRHQMALILGFIGEFDESLAQLDRLAVQFPQNLDVKYDLAMTQMMLGMQDEACANFNAILAVDPTHEKALQQSVYC
ncbi:tetratricopeptide repeat protein [bacterium]|nr:MAG: tetratricopeptide repeat protein [bacterium]